LVASIKGSFRSGFSENHEGEEGYTKAHKGLSDNPTDTVTVHARFQAIQVQAPNKQKKQHPVSA
jgi:hypothetical protein